MKSHNYLLIGAAALMLTGAGCGDDDEGGGTPTPGDVGDAGGDVATDGDMNAPDEPPFDAVDATDTPDDTTEPTDTTEVTDTTDTADVMDTLDTTDTTDTIDTGDVPPDVVEPEHVFIDRMGRPGVNTVLIGPNRKQDYNELGPQDWDTFAADLQAGLDQVNALDGTEADPDGSDPIAPSSVLASVLADDRLWIDTSVPNCDTFLAAELRATGLNPAATGCGGRAPTYDVIDSTLVALVGVESGLSDFVANDSAFLAHFPFLAPPRVPGAWIDRMGRPGVNTALLTGLRTQAYNEFATEDYEVAWWLEFVDEMVAALNALDLLDGENDNDDLTFEPLVAGTLSDDRLRIQTDVATCGMYLAVELATLGVVPPGTDCGGRGLSYDVIDLTLSLLIGGLDGQVTDFVADDSPFEEAFPFLADPNVID